MYIDNNYLLRARSFVAAVWYSLTGYFSLEIFKCYAQGVMSIYGYIL